MINRLVFDYFFKRWINMLRLSFFFFFFFFFFDGMRSWDGLNLIQVEVKVEEAERH